MGGRERESLVAKLLIPSCYSKIVDEGDKGDKRDKGDEGDFWRQDLRKCHTYSYSG